jgi:predicted nuclease of predicted toxin-antitoxin system
MASFCTDEHVPSVFVTTLRSNGYTVVPATERFGEETEDRTLLEYCAEQGHLFVTHDKKDFAGSVGAAVDHAGILIDTDPIPLRERPTQVVRAIELILEQYPQKERDSERIWIDQWYDLV